MIDNNPHAYASEDYTKVLRETHGQKKGWGNGGKGWADVVQKFAFTLTAKTVLDYGCGQGSLKKRLDEIRSGLIVREYDPGIPAKSALPERADLVVATDVLEHIEPELVDNVLAHIKSLAVCGVFLNIALSKANLILSDGRNAHLTVMPQEWWLEMLRKHGYQIIRYNRPKGLNVWAR